MDNGRLERPTVSSFLYSDCTIFCLDNGPSGNNNTDRSVCSFPLFMFRGCPVDYSLTDDQKQIIETARKFARTEFPKVARECDREEKFPRDVWQKAGEWALWVFSFRRNTGDSG